MLAIITPVEATTRPTDDSNYFVDFYWRGNAVLERIMSGIKENSCGMLRSLRFTWCRPKSKASTEEIFCSHTLPAMLDAARLLANSSFVSLHIEKVTGLNNLFALTQFANGVVAELELNECLPLTMPDTCFIKANFTNGHITNQPLVGHFNEEGAIMATDEALQTMICETNNLTPTESVIEQMRQRFRVLAKQGTIPSGNQGVAEIIKLVNQAFATGGK